MTITGLTPGSDVTNKIEQKQPMTGKVITIISNEQIKANAGKTIAEILNDQASIYLPGANSNPGTVPTIYMRGAASGRTLILIDGAPVGDPSMISNEFDLNLIPFLFKNDNKARALEGLASYIEVAYGEVPDLVQLMENGVKFFAPVHEGQKTGWFYDHRESRAQLQRVVKGKRVLDVFSYAGSWGVQAAAFGAAEVTCVDASEFALEIVQKNAALNGLDNVKTLQGDAFAVLSQLKQQGEQFDVIVLDPPAFMQKRKDHANGLQAYRRVNELAMRLLVKDGILVSGSCSMHLKTEELVDVIRGASRHLDKTAQVVFIGGRGADHPVHPAIPETSYLKCVMARVLGA